MTKFEQFFFFVTSLVFTVTLGLGTDNYLEYC